MAGVTSRDDSRDRTLDDMAAIQIENLALREEIGQLRDRIEELEQLVVRDTLTPLYNRRHFVACLRERLHRLERYGARSALVFVDVDGMKAINDRFGHGAGDLALNHIARLLLGSIRSSDVAARIGGDEFALLIEGLDEERAQAMIDRLVQAIAENACLFHGQRLTLGVSCGCTVLQPGDSDMAAMARADLAMYAVKRAVAGAQTGKPS